VEALSRDIEDYAAKNRFQVHTRQAAGSQIVVDNYRGASAYIKVTSDGKGPDSFMFSSETIKMQRGNEDEVLKAILDWMDT
jgi:hypothetical protein